MITNFEIYEGNVTPHNSAISKKILKLFLLNSYWKFENSMQDSIMKVVGIDTDMGAIEFEIFLMSSNDKPDNQYIKLDFDFYDLNGFIEASTTVIFREATEKEKENFILTKEINKYNL